MVGRDESEGVGDSLTSEQAPRVLLVEDDANQLEAYRKLLYRAGYHTSVALTLESASYMVMRPDLTFEVAIIDLQLPDGFGGQLVQPLLHNTPLCRSLIVTAKEDESTAIQLALAGAHTYIIKPADHADLLQKVKDTHQSTMAWRAVAKQSAPPRNARTKLGKMPCVIDMCQALERLQQIGKLTPRQVMVAGRLLWGDSNAQIALHLGIKEYTARNHAKAIFDAVGVENRAQLWRVLLEDAGITSPDAASPLLQSLTLEDTPPKLLN